MKIIFSIFCFFLLACAPKEQVINQDVLEEKIFIEILKDIHLADAEFELLKGDRMEQALKQKSKKYNLIYTKYNVLEDDFKASLSYYSKHQEKLNSIYKEVSKKLTDERASLNQQETN